MKNSNDFIKYLEWRGDLSFKQDAFNEVDAGILAFVSYVNLTSVETDNRTYQDILNSFFSMHKDGVEIGLFLPDYIVDLIKKASLTNRFGSLVITDCVNDIKAEHSQQFGATTYHIDDKHLVVVFEGTDDTLCGWLEDLNMILDQTVPCQVLAREYLENVYNKYKPEQITVVGHSKGGNMAVYAGVKQSKDILDKIDVIYSFDGPGFTDSVLNAEEAKYVESKIKNYVPDHSCVSQMFNLYGEIIACKSTNSGILQHSLDSWMLLAKEYKKVKLSKDCTKFHKAITEFLGKMSMTQKEDLCNAITEIVEKLEIKSLLDLKDNFIKVLPNVTFLQPKQFIQVMQFIGIILKYKML